MPDALYIPAPLGGTNDRMIAAFADALRGHTIEGFYIYDAQVAIDWFPQIGTLLVIRLLVDDPPAGAQIWPIERTMPLHSTVDGLAWKHCIVEQTWVRHIYLRNATSDEFPTETIASARAAAMRRSTPTQPDPEQ